MARVHYWQYIVDSEGRPMEDIEVRFYLNDKMIIQQKKRKSLHIPLLEHL